MCNGHLCISHSCTQLQPRSSQSLPSLLVRRCSHFPCSIQTSSMARLHSLDFSCRFQRTESLVSRHFLNSNVTDIQIHSRSGRTPASVLCSKSTLGHTFPYCSRRWSRRISYYQCSLSLFNLQIPAHQGWRPRSAFENLMLGYPVWTKDCWRKLMGLKGRPIYHFNVLD